MSAKKDYRKMIWNYDTSRWDREEMKKVYQEIYEVMPKDDEALEEFINEENSIYLEDERLNVLCHEKVHGKKTYVIEAHCGLWWGNPVGYAVKKGMWDAISKCLQDYNTIYCFGGGVYVEGIHHDGTNVCRIKELTERGEKYYLKHYGMGDDGEMFHYLFSDRHLSHNPKLFKEMYGW